MVLIIRREQIYHGQIKAVILDWAGTTVDYGSLAPVIAFQRAFEHHGIDVSADLIRASMGKDKRQHLREVFFSDQVKTQWSQTHKREPTEEDVEGLYRAFQTIQIDVLTERASLIPGTSSVCSELRQRGLKIGSTTGYTREMMSVLVPVAHALGFQPDSVICASDVPEGRPAPWMALMSAMEMRVYPMQAVVKIGDTPVDMAEGRNAGMWAVGVALTGNEIGLDEDVITTLSPEELKARLHVAYEHLYQAGAHFVVDGIWDIPLVLDQIQHYLIHGESP